MEGRALWQRWQRCAQGWAPLWLLFGLSAFDGLATHCFLRAGLAEELNPLMRQLWERSPLLFGAFKAATALGALAALRLGRHSALAASLLLTALAAYGLLACVHLFWICRACQSLWSTWSAAALRAQVPALVGALAALSSAGLRGWRWPRRAPP